MAKPEAGRATDALGEVASARPAAAPAAPPQPPAPRIPRGETLGRDNALAQVRTNLDRAKKEQRQAEDRKQAGAARQAAPMLRNLWGSTFDFTDYGRLVLPPNQVLVVVRVRPVETAAEAAIQVETVPPDATQRRAVEQAAPAKE